MVLAYLVGSIPFAVVVSRLLGLQDPRRYGSGNPGATNVLRSGNKLAALLTLLGDAAKGAVVVLVAKKFFTGVDTDVLTLAACALIVFLGHVFSVFLRFKGGKGVATAAGVLFGIHALIGLQVLVVWLAVAIVTRYSSLAALIAALAAPCLALLHTGSAVWTAATAGMSLILIWRHKDNIRRLLAGQESRIGSKKA